MASPRANIVIWVNSILFWYFIALIFPDSGDIVPDFIMSQEIIS